MTTLLKFLIRQKILILLVIFALILKLLFLAKWLDDWDSIQLALGLHEYSLPKHQPHPPGYPIYILLGKFFLFFFKNDTSTLTIMSAVFGSLTLIPFYLLVKKIFTQKLAIFSAIALTLTPVVWMLSITALTDIVGLFFVTLTGFLIYFFAENKRATVYVSFLAGLIIGVRFNEFPVILGLLLWAMLKQKNLKYVFYQLLAVSLGGLTWLLPMIFITGWPEFYETFTGSGKYVAEHDLLLGNTHSVLGLLKTKILLIIPLFKLGYTIPFTLIFLLSLLWTFTQRKLWPEKWYQFSLVYLFAYLLLLITFFNLELPRHILPLVIPMILITTYAVKALITKNRLFSILPLVLLMTTGQQGYSQVSRFKSSLPATIAPVLYIKQHYNPHDTVIYASYTLRNFEYYAPEFKSIDQNSDKTSITPDKTVIIDLPDLAKDPLLENFQEVDTQYFSAAKDIFPKVDSIQLHILKYKKP